MPSLIWPGHCWSDLAAYPPASNGQFSVAGLRGITACKVYPNHSLLKDSVGPYPTFSPLSAKGGKLFSVALSVPDNRDPAVNRCIALSCPDFPLRRSGAMAQLVAAQI